ncbi:hypothetical protein [Hymenobacter coccineus]|uniref:Uncharacterized protein n=1 Tax=Hymenobacter coccineus TaxID=1908235 RepID=A0A1G1SXH5_9BACT|nr:hypothetical protein [Hymenobacter coccineus]OGX83326.1 hypothetical protein BEN49_12595 [Hymenobacter coccineus]
MTDAEFHESLGRIRRRHWLHYGAQALLMGGVVLATGPRMAVGAAANPRLATWPALLLLGALVPVVGALLYAVSRGLRPNLRRPYAENLRVYQARTLLRDSLLGLLALPLLASYVVTQQATDLAICGGLLLVLGRLTVPSVKTYQRWLVR